MNLTSLLQTWLSSLLMVRALVAQVAQDRMSNLPNRSLSLLPSQSGLTNRLNRTSLFSDLPSNSRPAVFCDGDRYGRDLIIADCKDAITAIKRSKQQVRYGERTADRETWDVGLPFRQIGIQGLCIAQLEFKPGRSSATASSFDVYQAAVAVLGTCVAGIGRNTGGLAIDIGGDNNLGVALAPYNPHVECPDASIGPPGSTVPPLKSCETIANLMFATKGLNSFGKAGSGAQITVPATDSSPDHLCFLKVDTTGPVDRVSWYDVWAAVVAVNGMCVRDGKTGRATGLGQNGNLFVTLWNPNSRSGLSLLSGNTSLLNDATPSKP